MVTSDNIYISPSRHINSRLEEDNTKDICVHQMFEEQVSKAP
ncbi:hypothetical protein [Dulcicalothrix desertica]|nr:hypothetical protein [Dulcicalothrix desertica]